MNYKELTPTEFHNNVVEEIADLCITLAHRNSNFICEECMSTLHKLHTILGCLDDDVYTDVAKEVNYILEKEEL